MFLALTPGHSWKSNNNGVRYVFAGFFPQRERQAQREDALELTEKLDQDWKEIQTLLSRKSQKSENKEKKEKPQVGSTLHKKQHKTNVC